jgi:hypothetical protein
MKRLATISWLLDRQNPWLPWWQELMLNWVASWSTIGTIHITAADGEHCCEWFLPSDLEHQRAELEQLLER